VKYGNLALGVVWEDTFSGRVANTFMVYQGIFRGVIIDRDTAEQIGVAPMRADYQARRNTEGTDIGHDQI